MQALQPSLETSIVNPEGKVGMCSAASVLTSPYDAIATWYNEGIRRGGSLHDFVLPELFELIGQTRGRTICDLACGQGVLSRRLAGQGAHVVGVDLSAELLQIAQREELSDPLGITYLHDDAQQLHRLADATFDGVVCNLALMDIADLAQQPPPSGAFCSLEAGSSSRCCTPALPSPRRREPSCMRITTTSKRASGVQAIPAACGAWLELTIAP